MSTDEWVKSNELINVKEWNKYKWMKQWMDEGISKNERMSNNERTNHNKWVSMNKCQCMNI